MSDGGADGIDAADEVRLNRIIRLVIDESSFDWRGLDAAAAEEQLEAFNEALQALERETVAKPPWFLEIECREGLSVMTVAYDPEHSPVDRDTRVLFGILLSKCGEWDDTIPGIPTDVSLDGAQAGTTLSIGYALHHVAHGFGVACLVFGTPRRRGPIRVEAKGLSRDVYFFAEPSALQGFWRTLFELEAVREVGFLEIAAKSFPNLEFAAGLDFRRFQGNYDSLRPWVVKALAAINDSFAQAMREAAGANHVVISHLAKHGVEASPDSPKTHRNAKAMRERVIEHRGERFDCEWHAKQHKGTPNRIHFSLPDQRLDGRILVGVFTGHLRL